MKYYDGMGNEVTAYVQSLEAKVKDQSLQLVTLESKKGELEQQVESLKEAAKPKVEKLENKKKKTVKEDANPQPE